MTQNATYRHTQTSPLSAGLIAIGIGLLCFAWAWRGEPGAAWTTGCVSALMLLAAGSVQRLTVIGEESGVLLQFGPIPLFAKRIPYSTMTAVEASRSSWIDGWGIHYIPGRGWTYNIWGFDCVLIRRAGKRPIRIGTDDVDGLLRFLQSRAGS
jgi:hypothetical protein